MIFQNSALLSASKSIINHEENNEPSFISKHLEALKEFSRLDPDECLESIACKIREILNCEAVCILLWNESKQRLITEFQCGLPESLRKPEEYALDKGITGKYIFSREKWIRCLIDTNEKRVEDFHTGLPISDDTINWRNIQRYKHNSRFNDFKSLLGAPFFVKNQKPGVIKLINKIDTNQKTLTAHGFSVDDEHTLNYFLNTIEYIVETKRNEKQIRNFITIHQKIARGGFNYEDIMNEIVFSCADILNLRRCLIRLLEDGRLLTKACNIGLSDTVEFDPTRDPAALALEKRISLKWMSNSSGYLFPVTLMNPDGTDTYNLSAPSDSVAKTFQDYQLKSLLIVPIIHHDNAIGTLECYTSLPHDFSEQEINVVQAYANLLVTSLANIERFRASERLLQIINDVSNKESLDEIYELILEQTIDYFGFDYGAISRVDYRSRIVRTVKGKSSKPSLVNPEEWRELSSYNLDNDNDILVDVVKNKRSEIIIGPEVHLKWDPRLNKVIFEKFNHKNLIRIYVPFILHDGRMLDQQREDHVIGVIEAGYHVDTQSAISVQQRESFELFVKYCAGSLQRMTLIEDKKTIDKVLERLNANERLLSNSEDIYATLVSIIEEVLKTKTVSVWEKRNTIDDYELNLICASKSLHEEYKEVTLFKSSQDSFTAEAVNSRKIIEANLDFTKAHPFAPFQYASENKLRSVGVIPVCVGEETIAVIYVLLKRERRFFREEKAFLELFANKAAIAIQKVKLVQSFNSISEALPDVDVNAILQKITDCAFEVLHADPVILFRYNAEQKAFSPKLIASGNFFYSGVQDTPKIIKETDLVNLILKGGTTYLENEQEYSQLQQRSWESHRFTKDFWSREKIRSLAALRLEHRNEVVGVMFFNYRTYQKFSEPTKELIKAFAAQAASAIFNAKLLEQNQVFWETQRRDSFSLSISEIVSSLAHNSGNLLGSINVWFAKFEDYVNKVEGKNIDREKAQQFIGHWREPLDDLVKDFSRLEDYRKFDNFQEDYCQVEELIDSSLYLLRTKLEKRNISIKRNFTQTPRVLCDRHQVQHMLLNLLLNALDAMGKKGILSVGTELKDGYVQIRITDNGTGIPPALHSRIFEPFFTTKHNNGGTGLGLPISRYIAQKHGGRIDFTSKSGKESSFFIYLPIPK